jgi:hypothetical protein
MPNKWLSPVDELTGLPLPILTNFEPKYSSQPTWEDWHHHFHPKLDNILDCEVGGRFLRHSRIQLA